MAISQIYLFILLGQFIGVLEKRENGRDVRRPPLERKCIETLYKFKNSIALGIMNHYQETLLNICQFLWITLLMAINWKGVKNIHLITHANNQRLVMLRK